MKKLLFVFLTTFALTANSAVINEITNPYLDNLFLDAGISNVDTTTNLEWLKFRTYPFTPANNNTFSNSITEAEAYYGASNGSWRVAYETEVSNLFRMFFPTFSDGGGGSQVIIGEDPTSLVIQSRNSWMTAFGADVDLSGGSVTLNNSSLFSQGLYRNDDHSIGLTGIMLAESSGDLATVLYGSNYTLVDLSDTQPFTNIGVFMVRDYIPAVPIPAAVWLFGSGLLGLVAVARRKS